MVLFDSFLLKKRYFQKLSGFARKNARLVLRKSLKYPFSVRKNTNFHPKTRSKHSVFYH